MKKLSIIIPVYNVVKYLSKCIDSVIDESLDDYEIVLVNDGSTDSSPTICEEYAKRFPSLIHYVSTENGGLGAARNAALKIAEGEYVFFLDSDDYVPEGTVAEMLEVLSGGHDIYVFDYDTVTEAGETLSFKAGCDKKGVFSFEEYPELMFAPPNACNKLWRKSLFEESGILYPSRVWFEDLSTSPVLYLYAKSIMHVEKNWYKYLQRPGSITNNTNPARNLEIIPAVDSIINGYKKRCCYEKYKDVIEYTALNHQVISSTTRICLTDAKHPALKELYRDFIAKFPEYRANPYVNTLPKKHKLLLFFVEHGMYGAFALTMRLNRLVKYRNV